MTLVEAHTTNGLDDWQLYGVLLRHVQYLRELQQRRIQHWVNIMHENEAGHNEGY